MTQQIFIQTDSRVIDVSKIACMDISGEGDVLIQFVGGACQNAPAVSIPRAEAEALLDAMANTRELICIRAEPAAAPHPKPRSRPKRKGTGGAEHV